MPHLLVWLTQQRRYRKGVNYMVPPMFWGLNRNELQTIRAWHPHIAEVREVPFVGGRGVAYRMVLPIMRRLPWVGNHLFALVHVRCGPDVAPPYANQG